MNQIKNMFYGFFKFLFSTAMILIGGVFLLTPNSMPTFGLNPAIIQIGAGVILIIGLGFSKIKLQRLFNLLFSWGLIFVGGALLISPTPIPGTDLGTSKIIAFVVLVIGLALSKIIGIQAHERIRARAWKEVMQE